MKPSSKFKVQKPAAASDADAAPQSSSKQAAEKEGQLQIKIKSEIIDIEDQGIQHKGSETEKEIERRRALEILGKDLMQASPHGRRERSRSPRQRSPSNATTLVLGAQGSACYCSSSASEDDKQ